MYEHRYGIRLEARLNVLELELYCMRVGHRQEDGGLGRYGHFRVVCQMVFPWIEWNPWLEWLCQRLLEFPAEVERRVRRRTMSLTGCGAAGKTFGVTLVAVVWWMCDPANSSVVLTSTEKSVIRRRMWPVVDRLFKGMCVPGTGMAGKQAQWLEFGHFVDSMTKWNAQKGDDLHGVTAVAVAKGDTQKAVDYLKGVHARRMFLMIDEATATPEAIMLTITNMEKGCDELVVVIIGNAVSKMDPHGRACEPMAGWESVTVEDEEWPTKGVAEWGLEPGVCLHFDGKKSPNVLAGKNVAPRLFSVENWEKAVANADKDGVGFWSQTRGFWPPAGVTDSIFAEQALIKHGARRKDVVWLGKTTRIAFLDPAFGGDNCVFLSGTFGETADGGGEVLMFDEPECVPITADPSKKHEVEYQIMEWCRARCWKLGVRPECFGLDAWGTGRGVRSIFAREWSTAIQSVEWGEGPSDRAAGADDPRPAKEVYANQSTELHFRLRDMMWAGQLRGVALLIAQELCARTYTMTGRKYQVQTKDDYKLRNGKSPDYGDAGVGLGEVARRNGMKSAVVLQHTTRTEWKRAARRVAEADEAGGGEQAFAEDDYEQGEVRQLW